MNQMSGWRKKGGEQISVGEWRLGRRYKEKTFRSSCVVWNGHISPMYSYWTETDTMSVCKCTVFRGEGWTVSISWVTTERASKYCSKSSERPRARQLTSQESMSCEDPMYCWTSKVSEKCEPPKGRHNIVTNFSSIGPQLLTLHQLNLLSLPGVLGKH